jgi:hypothetical protein
VLEAAMVVVGNLSSGVMLKALILDILLLGDMSVQTDLIFGSAWRMLLLLHYDDGSCRKLTTG